MKTSFITACVVLATASVLFSCDWLTGKSSKAQQSFSLEGNWQIDSVDVKSDSSIVGILALSVLSKDSVLNVKFTKDTIYVNQANPAAYRITDQQIIIQEDSVQHSFDWIKRTDSTLTIRTEDSTSFFLKRIKE
jgi:hypothetical protein